MDGTSIVTTPQASLEWTSTGPRHMYFLYDQARYMQSSTSDGWWQRTLALDPFHWIRLRGSSNTTPLDALQTILANQDRPPIVFPALLVALFLAHSPHPDTVEQRQVFRWVAHVIPELLARIPSGSLQAGWEEMSSDRLEHMLIPTINVILDQEDQVPWVFPDGIWVQVLDHLADVMWRFPPKATRRIASASATQLEQIGIEEEESGLADRHASTDAGWSVIGYLSAIRFWRSPWPTIRGLSVQASMLEFLQIWQQALVIMHPDAPAITDTNLTWLCDGTLGAPYDGPFDSLLVASADIARLGISTTEMQERIVRLQQEAARGICRPSGRWDVRLSSNWPILLAYGVTSMSLVAGPKGLWVRLIPAQQSWGSVLWWRPQKQAPTCWSLVLGSALTSIQILALHETMWQVWRDLRVCGQPVTIHSNRSDGWFD